MRPFTVFRTQIILAIALLAVVFAPLSGAQAWTYKILYSFCSQNDCSDGQAPSGDLAWDANGNLFGTTASGGDVQGDGVAFELKYNKRTQAWVYKRLYTFCESSCADGSDPVGHLVVATNGDIYGITRFGGNGGGTIFRLSKPGNSWGLTVLHTFCAQGDSCLDGATPLAGLTYVGAASGALYDGVSSLYGVTQGGGAEGYGVAFQIAPGAKHWKQTVIYNFCSLASCADGSFAESPLIANAAGDLFGTSSAGGSGDNAGTVFELTSNGGRRWHQKVLYSFCNPYPCRDGIGPLGQLAMDAGGSLYGTTDLGGANDNNQGVLYRLTPNGRKWQYQVLYNFCSEANCADGAVPRNGVVLDGTGHIFGAAREGGNFNQDFGETSGVAYEFSGSNYRVTYSFCSQQPHCTDGASPYSNLIMDKSGNLFGIAQVGGANNNGVVFEVSP